MNQWPLTDVVATYFRPSGSICLSVQSFARKALVAFVTSCRTRLSWDPRDISSPERLWVSEAP